MAGCLLPPSGKSGNSRKNSSRIGSPYPSDFLGLARAAQPAAWSRVALSATSAADGHISAASAKRFATMGVSASSFALRRIAVRTSAGTGSRMSLAFAAASTSTASLRPSGARCSSGAPGGGDSRTRHHAAASV
eukprot:4637781-Prymnesium_polylepis.1